MPIFEYTCQSCGHRFEQLTRAGLQPACPACQATALTKHLSVFAVASADGSRRNAGGFDGPVAPCGTCGDPRGPGACSLN